MKTLAKQLLVETNTAKQIALRTAIKAIAKKLTFTTIGKAKRDTGLSYLGSVNSSAKIVKNIKKNYNTYIVYLAPHTISGHNTCAKASEGCISACLNTSGRVKMDTEQKILTARLLKTLLFYGNREFYNQWLFAEIESAKKSAEKKGHKFSVRLNGTSDLSPKLFNVDKVNVLDKFKTVQFYDYTKVANRMGTKNKNYHLTFSFSGDNMSEVVKALDNGHNVAVPFLVDKNKALPTEFLGHKVGDADETDLRFLDKLRIAGLRVKITKDRNAIKTAVDKGFVIDPNNFDLATAVAV
jgi:hypothetical protein